jgi:hypothetical protein
LTVTGFLNRCLKVVANPIIKGRMTGICPQFTRPAKIM